MDTSLNGFSINELLGLEQEDVQLHSQDPKHNRQQVVQDNCSVNKTGDREPADPTDKKVSMEPESFVMPDNYNSGDVTQQAVEAKSSDEFVVPPERSQYTIHKTTPPAMPANQRQATRYFPTIRLPPKPPLPMTAAEQSARYMARYPFPMSTMSYMMPATGQLMWPTPMMQSRAPTMTSNQHLMPSGPMVMSTSPQLLLPRPPTMAWSAHQISSSQNAMSTRPPIITLSPSRTPTGPAAMSASPRMMQARTPTMMSSPNQMRGPTAMHSNPQMMLPGNPTMYSNPQLMVPRPPTINPYVLPARPQTISTGPYPSTSRPHTILTRAPHSVLLTPNNVHQKQNEAVSSKTPWTSKALPKSAFSKHRVAPYTVPTSVRNPALKLNSLSSVNNQVHNQSVGGFPTSSRTIHAETVNPFVNTAAQGTPMPMNLTTTPRPEANMAASVINMATGAGGGITQQDNTTTVRTANYIYVEPNDLDYHLCKLRFQQMSELVKFGPNPYLAAQLNNTFAQMFTRLQLLNPLIVNLIPPVFDSGTSKWMYPEPLNQPPYFKMVPLFSIEDAPLENVPSFAPK